MATVIESVGVVTGGRRRRRSAHALADAAARRALDLAGLAAADVDLLVNAGLYHDRNLGEPALAALIQEDIGANPEDPHAGGHGTFSFDVANGSCGMLTALQVVDGFLRAGTIRHALVVASDANPGHRLAPGFPFPAAGAAIVCGWRPGADGLQGFRFGSPPDGDGDDGGVRGAGDGLRATVGRAGGRNRLTIDEDPAFARSAGAWAGEVADKLLADHGLTPADIDAVVANPLVPEFQEALATRLGVSSDRLSCRSDGAPVHTAGLAVALEAARHGGDADGRTLLLVSAGAGLMAGAALLRG
jgi:3-oxoacyl-[acyl-carrier-protein] synthase III